MDMMPVPEDLDLSPDARLRLSTLPGRDCYLLLVGRASDQPVARTKVYCHSAIVAADSVVLR